LGVNATSVEAGDLLRLSRACFNGHPPLGVNATGKRSPQTSQNKILRFQWAPTLGGECYLDYRLCRGGRSSWLSVSMGTHPWG